MNMSIKVLKKTETGNLPKFSLPNIGETKTPQENYSNFIVPAISELNNLEQPSDEISDSTEEDRQTAEDILETTRQEAKEIIEKAERDSEMIQKAAEERGLQKVEETVQERLNEQLAEIRQELNESIDKLTSLETNIIETLDDDLVKFALEIAKKVVKREVTIDREIALTLVQVSLKRLHDRTIAEVHLNPEDFAFIELNREKLKFRGSIKLIEDASISFGGCLIHTENGDMDARIESQFDEISYGLLNS